MTKKEIRIRPGETVTVTAGDEEVFVEAIAEPGITVNGDPVDQKLNEMVAVAGEALSVSRQNALSIIADARRAFNRAMKRAEADASKEWERVEITQQRGPTVGFNGKLLADTEFMTKGHDPMKVTFEIWMTSGGALVAVSSTEPVEREGVEVVNVTVVEPCDDDLAQRVKMMDHFQWHDRARSMVRKLGWNMTVEVA